jgi:pimeloyl-ACP methyl ester carboxylesterase
MTEPPPTKARKRRADELRAASKLVVEATRAATGVVEEMHRTIASGPPILGRPLAGPARALTGLVYGTIRLVTGVVGVSIDTALEQLAPLIGEADDGVERDAVLAVLNGVLGDYLSEMGNALATPMSFRHGGAAMELETEAIRQVFPQATGKLLILVHGSSMNDRQWSRQGHDHGRALARDLGYTPVYLHCNTGLHISENGQGMAQLLERLVGAWPVPIEQIGILGHSMGGLVARSACYVADRDGLTWRKKLRKLVCLGSPHHGSAIERGGSWIHTLLGVSSYSRPLARVARIRSAGVTDMRFGNVIDAHWKGVDRFVHAPDARCTVPLPQGVDCYAMAATPAMQMAERLPGDGLVSIDSALGRHARSELSLEFPPGHTWIALGSRHLDLLNRPEVYDQLKEWFA